MKEGSFDGVMSGLDFAQNDIVSISEIKTPDQVPDRIDLSQVPESALRSRAIDSLINQNDDLMSRLTVSLRRIAQLEEKLQDARNSTAQYKAKYENLNDQVLILREQGRLLIERTKAGEEKRAEEDRDIQKLKEQIQLLEIRYAELYTSSQNRQQALRDAAEKAEKKTKCYQKYRTNLKRALIPFRHELDSLRQKRQLHEATISDLRKNLTEATAHISTQSKEHKHQLHHLTEEYESQIRRLNSELQEMKNKNHILSERAQEADRLFTEKVKLENDLIISQRQKEELKVQTTAELADVQKALARYRHDAQDLALRLEERDSELKGITENRDSLLAEKAALAEQVEALQLLWRDQQNQIEKLNEQKNSLQKLNQELSIHVNEYRRELRELKEKADASLHSEISSV